MTSIGRLYDHQSVTVDGSAPASSTKINYGDWSAGEVHVPTGSSITSLTWHVYDETAAVWRPAQDASGVAVTQTVAANKSYPIPAALAGAKAIAPVGNASGTVAVDLKG